MKSLIYFVLGILIGAYLPFYADAAPKAVLSCPADLSFIIMDLKFNEADGVKICEMQPGRVSVFNGYDYLNHGDGLVAEMFCERLAKYRKNLWFAGRDISDHKFKNKFLQNGWKNITDISSLSNDSEFLYAASFPVKDQSNIHNYHGIVYAKFSSLQSQKQFKERYPGILVIDSNYFPYFKDKHVMDIFLTSTPKLKKLRPKSQLYEKNDLQNLAKKILQDFESDLLVIKPTNSTQGQGVIILHRESLKEVIDYLFNAENRKVLAKEDDLSYRYWALDRNNVFLVEQFIPSDPVNVPQFDNRQYDGTMRVVLLLVYSQKKFKLDILEGHWKLPKVSLSEEGTLNERHKSYGKMDNFAAVNPEVLEKVTLQLREGLKELYE